jgi:uncharacterized protein (TIGR03067 family)
MRRIAFVGLLLAATAAGAPAPFAKPEGRPDRRGDWARLHGEWEAIGQEEGISLRLTFTPGQLHRRDSWPVQSGERCEWEKVFAVQLDQQALPKRIEFTLQRLKTRLGQEESEWKDVKELTGREMKLFGVYRFDGEDLVICSGANFAGKVRPTSFDADGWHTHLTVYRRKR